MSLLLIFFCVPEDVALLLLGCIWLLLLLQVRSKEGDVSTQLM